MFRNTEGGMSSQSEKNMQDASNSNLSEDPKTKLSRCFERNL